MKNKDIKILDIPYNRRETYKHTHDKKLDNKILEFP